MSVIEQEMQPAIETASTDMTTADVADLLRYEAVIKRGLQTFVEVGNALERIRDGKLYRGTHSDFAEYCKERWGFTDRRARMLIDAAEVVGNLESGTTVPVLPASERQARPLTKLEPEQQREAWADAVEDAGGKQPTPAQTEKAAAKQTEPKPVYAPVWDLEHNVNTWLVEQERAGVPLSPDHILDALKVQTTLMRTPDNLLDKLDWWLGEAGVIFRKSDLTQAINNVREQRKQAARQAQLQQGGRAVYVEPAPEGPNADEMRDFTERSRRVRVDLDLPDPDEAAAVAMVEAEREEEDAERVQRDELRLPVARAVVEPASILTLEWIAHALSHANPANADFATALGAATADQVRAAMAELSTEDKGHAERLAAYRGRLAEMEPDPVVVHVEQVTVQPLPVGPPSVTLTVALDLLKALHSDLMTHYPGRSLTPGQRHTLAGILYRALTVASVVTAEVAQERSVEE